MRQLRRPTSLPWASLLLLSLLLISSTSFAQNLLPTPSQPSTDAATTTTEDQDQSTSRPAPSPTSNPASASVSPSPSSPRTTEESDSSTSTTDNTSDEATATSESETTSDAATITPTGSVATTQSATPSITGSGSSASSLSRNLPTLSGAYSYPPPSVPPTAGAPFMQRSTLPEGTVFIVVGAILGFLGFSVLAWRGLVAWSVHRSVKRAAMEQHMSDAKVMLRPRGSGIYAAGAGSTLSLDHLSTTNMRSGSFAGKGSHLSTGSLFFSPTAHAGTGVDTPANRGSSYLPAGYYAAGAATPGGGSGMTHLGTPQARSYSRGRSVGPSPPVSPSISPGRAAETGYGRSLHGPIPHGSTSTLNLSVPPQGRAPSAYLEDLFESHQSQPGGSNRF